MSVLEYECEQVCVYESVYECEEGCVSVSECVNVLMCMCEWVTR